MDSRATLLQQQRSLRGSGSGSGSGSGGGGGASGGSGFQSSQSARWGLSTPGDDDGSNVTNAYLQPHPYIPSGIHHKPSVHQPVGEKHLKMLLAQNMSESEPKLSVFSQSRPLDDISTDDKILKFVQLCRNVQMRIKVRNIRCVFAVYMLLHFLVDVGAGSKT
jgi:hypothetical protein